MRRPDGVFVGRWSDLQAVEHYWYRVDGRGPFPDPASRWQPCGVHGPSALVDATAYRWRDDGFRAPTLAEAVIYELHIGTFTPEGTFTAAADKLAVLAALGVNAIEVMPIGAFAGSATGAMTAWRCSSRPPPTARNDVALVRRLTEGGRGLDAVWADDLHHHLRRLLAGS